MKALARIGCLTRAAVYFLVGVLAFLVAVGNPNGATTDESGVLRRIFDQPFGHVLLFVLALGLFSYAGWRMMQSIQDHDRYGRSWRGLCVRSGFFFSGVGHLGLGLYALNLLFGITKRTRLGERMMARWMLLQPFGRHALFAIGLGVVLTGFVQFIRAGNGSFTRDLSIPRHRTLLITICRIGLVARGTVFTIIGSFLVTAAWTAHSREAGGLHQAWEILREQPGGGFLLGTVSAGFVAFAVFAVIDGFYRKRDFRPVFSRGLKSKAG